MIANQAVQSPVPVPAEVDEAHAETSQAWRNTFLAGLANYVDAGSIVASSAALVLWVKEFGLTTTFVGMLGAFSANAISAGVGALIGGVLCDRYGRKLVFQWDMLFYAFGMLWLVFAVQPWMLVVGFVLVGLAVGADIPASWSLIAEMAPAGKRAKHSGVAQVLWCLGPMIVLVLFVILYPLGLWGARIVFAHLLVLALLLALLRSRMQESPVWQKAKASRFGSETAAEQSAHEPLKALFTRRNFGAMAFLIGFYGIWNLYAGTNGFYFQYMLTTVGAQSLLSSHTLRAGLSIILICSIFFIFMQLSDRVNQRKLILISSIIQIFGASLLALFPLTTGLIVFYGALMALGSGFGQQPFYQLWSAELFPTLLRATAQGLTFAVVRVSLGLWSFFVPSLMATDFTTLAWIMTGFLTVSGAIGLIWAPRNEGKSLEQLQAERDRRFETA
jgi:inositol transporter-like SP family MFS transporter